MAATALKALPAVERLSPRCIRILGGNPGKFTLQGTNTYLLGTGYSRILIDTGEGRQQWIDCLKTLLEKENATVESVLISHWHHDHTGGIEDLLTAYPKATIFRNDPSPGQLPLQDGDRFQTEGASLTAFYTPGHTRDHMVFVLAEEDSMFTADNVLGHGTAVFEDLGTYIQSLEKMKTLFRGRAYPGHGPIINDGPDRINEYIIHRQQREDQVLRTLKTLNPRGGESEKSWTAMDVVKLVYKDTPEELHIAASGGVQKILTKLAREGRVMQTSSDTWELPGRSTL